MTVEPGDIVTVVKPPPLWHPHGASKRFRRVRVRRVVGDSITFTDPRNGGSRCVLTRYVTAIHRPVVQR